MTQPQQPIPLPAPKETLDFLLQGGAFALLCVMVIAGGVVLWFGGRALFRLLREFLGKQIVQLESQTKLLGEIHDEQKSARMTLAATAAASIAWGSPEWLKERISGLETRAEEIKKAIGQLRVELAQSSTTRTALPGPG